MSWAGAGLSATNKNCLIMSYLITSQTAIPLSHHLPSHLSLAHPPSSRWQEGRSPCCLEPPPSKLCLHPAPSGEQGGLGTEARLCHRFELERGGAGQQQAPPAQPPKVPERSACSRDITELPNTTFKSTRGAGIVSMFFFLTRAPILFRMPRSQLKTHLSQPSLQPVARVHQGRGFWKS